MPVLTKDMAPAIITGGIPANMDDDVAASFKPGDKVLTRNINPVTHTRLPRYARGKVGTIHMCHGVFHTPDTIAHGKGHHPQQLYSVAFEARELWGDDASGRDKVYIDLWDDYMTLVTS